MHFSESRIVVFNCLSHQENNGGFLFPFFFFLSFLQKLADDKGQQQATEGGHTTLTSNLFCVEGEVPRYTL